MGKNANRSKTITNFLLDSEIKPLVFAGKSLQYFGPGVTIAFFLGILLTYTYALFKPLPYISKSPPETVTLTGKVTSEINEKPIQGFEIFIVETKDGPYHDGIFSIEVAKKKQYNIVVRDRYSLNYYMFAGYGTDKINDNYNLKRELKIPTNLGALKGKVIDQNGDPFKGYVQIYEDPIKIDDQGDFFIKNIPLGKVRIQFKKSINEPAIKQQTVKLDLDTVTPLEFIVTQTQ